MRISDKKMQQYMCYDNQALFQIYLDEKKQDNNEERIQQIKSILDSRKSFYLTDDELEKAGTQGSEYWISVAIDVCNDNHELIESGSVFIGISNEIVNYGFVRQFLGCIEMMEKASMGSSADFLSLFNDEKQLRTFFELFEFMKEGSVKEIASMPNCPKELAKRCNKFLNKYFAYYQTLKTSELYYKNIEAQNKQDRLSAQEIEKVLSKRPSRYLDDTPSELGWLSRQDSHILGQVIGSKERDRQYFASNPKSGQENERLILGINELLKEKKIEEKKDKIQEKPADEESPEDLQFYKGFSNFLDSVKEKQ